MRRYESPSIPEYLNITSIVTVLSTEFSASDVPPLIDNAESHNFPELLYIKEGARIQLVAGKKYPMKKGQMIIYAPLDSHTGYGEKSKVSIISFKANFGRLPSIFNRVITLSENQCRELERIIEVGSLCYERRTNISNVGGMLIREGISDYTLHKLKRDLELFLIDIYASEGLLHLHSTDGKKISRREEFDIIVEYLKTKLSDNLSVEEIAKASSVSVSKLKMLFREYASCGPIDFFIILKLERAKELICLGESNLSEIAESLGFSSLSYFSRIFKSRFGVSPSKWKIES